MRLIGHFQNIKLGQQFSDYLTAQGIENQAEIVVNRDWGSSEYGDKECRVWIIDEDKVAKALTLQDLFRQNPESPVFQISAQPDTEAFETSVDHNNIPPTLSDKSSPNEFPPNEFSVQIEEKQSLGPITVLLLAICCALLFISDYTTPSVTPPIPPFPPAALYTSPLKQKLLFDYPYAYTLVNKIEALYGIDRLRDPQELPPEGKKLTLAAYDTPFWQGIYNDLLIHWKHPGTPWDLQAPMFEKIRQGEIWRLWTPILLHSDIIHLLFNMIWLLILGKQMEYKLGSFRYIFFILIAAIVSNTLQYLMSGPNFIGFSGVLCAMLTFVWMRQRLAAWEGYQLQTSTMLFMTLFILAMGAIQLVSFFFEAFSSYSLSPGIANTAHLSGAAMGLALGRMHFFSERG